jgi:23S rRNA pseudouridine1911/1915/1917 synthase
MAGRLDSVLAGLDPALSRSAAGRLARAGLVTVNGRPERPSARIGEGDLLEYEPPERLDLAPEAEAIPLDVLYEDQDLVVIDKAAGMVVHPAPGNWTGTLVHALLGRGGNWSASGGAARPGIVHRLDKGTSGLMLAARNDQAHRALAAQLAARTLSRSYLAIVEGEIRTPAGILEGPIGRDPGNRLRMAVVQGGRPARTRYTVVERRAGHTLVRCDLESGRTHQVRVHLASLGHPVAGDELYGRRAARSRPGKGSGQARAGAPDRPLLHAWRLRFRHPRTGAEVSFEAEPPADFQRFWKSLDGGEPGSSSSP